MVMQTTRQTVDLSAGRFAKDTLLPRLVALLESMGAKPKAETLKS